MDEKAGTGRENFPSANKPFILLGQQKELYDVLSEKSIDLGDMYYGAIFALENDKNPERYAQCAHSIRELIVKIPDKIDVPLDISEQDNKGRITLKERVIKLRQEYCVIKRKKELSKCVDWINNLILEFDNFFKQFSEDHPSRVETMKKLLDRMDNFKACIPSFLRDQEGIELNKMRDYFVGICHHGSVRENEFRTRLDELERLFLRRLKPSTTEYFDEIDNLLEGGNRDANS